MPRRREGEGVQWAADRQERKQGDRKTRAKPKADTQADAETRNSLRPLKTERNAEEAQTKDPWNKRDGLESNAQRTGRDRVKGELRRLCQGGADGGRGGGRNGVNDCRWNCKWNCRWDRADG